jgi:hypothetical protein
MTSNEDACNFSGVNIFPQLESQKDDKAAQPGNRRATFQPESGN